MPLVTDLTETENKLRELRNLLKVGTTIFTTENYPGRSTTARVSLYIPFNRGRDGLTIQNLTHRAADVAGFHVRNGEIAMGGYGYSKSYHAVYALSRTLYPNGHGCIGEGCPSNDHSNGAPRDGIMHHSDGGYALRQSHL